MSNTTFKNLNEIDSVQHIFLGGPTDICNQCIDKLTANKKSEKEYFEARRQLKGKLEGQYVFRDDRKNITICMDCMKEIVNKYGENGMNANKEKKKEEKKNDKK